MVAAEFQHLRKVKILNNFRKINLSKRIIARVVCHGTKTAVQAYKETVSAMADGDLRLEGSPEYGGALGSFMVRVSNLLLG